MTKMITSFAKCCEALERGLTEGQYIAGHVLSSGLFIIDGSMIEDYYYVVACILHNFSGKYLSDQEMRVICEFIEGVLYPSVVNHLLPVKLSKETRNTYFYHKETPMEV